jgi:hypothetical protein
MSRSYRSPRTFGELLGRIKHSGRCAFCKRGDWTHGGVIKYSTRHSCCTACATARTSLPLPSVLRQERFDSRLRAALAEPHNIPSANVDSVSAGTESGVRACGNARQRIAARRCRSK